MEAKKIQITEVQSAEYTLATEIENLFNQKAKNIKLGTGIKVHYMAITDVKFPGGALILRKKFAICIVPITFNFYLGFVKYINATTIPEFTVHLKFEPEIAMVLANKEKAKIIKDVRDCNLKDSKIMMINGSEKGESIQKQVHDMICPIIKDEANKWMKENFLKSSYLRIRGKLMNIEILP